MIAYCDYVMSPLNRMENLKERNNFGFRKVKNDRCPEL